MTCDATGDELGGEMDSYLEEVMALSEQLDDMSTKDPEEPSHTDSYAHVSVLPNPLSLTTVWVDSQP
jgi:hypothetical protein